MGKFNVNVDELFRLKRDFENGIVTEEELSEPEHVTLAYVYELEEDEFLDEGV